jgi:hypothetical protein
MPSVAPRRTPWYRSLPTPTRREALFLSCVAVIVLSEAVYFWLLHRR